MSRERKANCRCWNCGRTGIKYVTEEYNTYNHSWEETNEALPDNWAYYRGDCHFLLCPKCRRDPSVRKEISVAYKKARTMSILYYLSLLIALSLSVLIFYLKCPIESLSDLLDALKYAAIPIALDAIVWGFLCGIAVGLLESAVLIIAVVSCIYFCDGNNTIEETNNPETTEIPKKYSPYLNGIDNISSLDELGIFYYDIAKKFNKNKMGLKGTPEQINAGNKLMVSVYDFLGTSAKNEDMLNVDSMKMIIKNFDPISDYRRKKAQEELQLGVEKIQSLNE